MSRSDKTSSSEPIACYCLATEHGLWANCQTCGKILCLLEQQYKKCTFCKTPQKPLNKPSNIKNTDPITYKLKVAPLTNKKINLTKDFPEINGALKKAEERKDKLLEFDKTGAKRSKVTDLSEDYNERWLSSKERDEIARKIDEKQQKKEKNFVLNLETRELEEEVNDKDEVKEDVKGMVQAPERDYYKNENLKKNFYVEDGKVEYVGDLKHVTVPLDEIKRTPIVQDDLFDE